MKREHITHLGRHFKLNFAGLLVGFAFYCFSLTPSLLPRPIIFEGVIAGVCFAVGYGLGVLLSWAVRRLSKKELPPKVKKLAWRVALFVVSAAAIAYGVQATAWQNEVRALIGETEFAGQHVLAIILVAFVTAAAVIFLARQVHRLIYILSEFIERWLPRQVSFAIGTVIVALILVWFYNGVLLKTFIAVSNNIYRSTNQSTASGVTRPASAFRSGGDGSLVSWESLGRKGRNFIAGGPSQEELAAFGGAAPAEPIRIYVGVDSRPTPEERAVLAVQEMERTGAFSRQVLVVMSATGTGWIEPQTADTIEYMHSGNTALVSVQYSYLPSWISFMVDRENSQQASRVLFDAVYEKWQALPEGSRPKLFVHGLSLGAYGAQSIFSGVADLQNRTDGALFVGSPNSSEPWSYFTQNRDQPSPAWQPTYQEGQTIRFAAAAGDIFKLGANWPSPRILYMQHASDPIVWWSPDLIWHEPDWLRETRGSDVSPKMQWYPFVTFFQVTVDQFFATFVPPGHGHNYSDIIVSAWEAVARPPDWPPVKTEALQAIISAYPIERL
ncbi:MAG: alpha/beta hydrolase [Candidatus Saccharimonadales bacterium]